MDIIYRTFKDLEINRLCELIEQLGYVHTEKSLLRNVQDLRKSGGEVFVAELDGRVVGCASAVIDVRLTAGVSGEVVSVVVKPEIIDKNIEVGLVKQCKIWLAGKVGSITVRANLLRTAAPKLCG